MADRRQVAHDVHEPPDIPEDSTGQDEGPVWSEENPLLGPDMPQDRRSKPSTRIHDELFRVRIYTDECHVYDNVKHVWWLHGAKVMAMVQYFADGTYRYVYWRYEHVFWHQMMPMSFGV